MATSQRFPTMYIPHGAGPCFFMEWTMGPRDTWDRLAAWLRGIDRTLPATPSALLVVSAHWEEAVPTVTTSPAPALLYDYSGFPEEAYRLTWPAPGSTSLAGRVTGLLGDAGIPSGTAAARGFDHGVFIPLKVAYPEAKLPTVQLSLRQGLSPAEHLAIGRALAPLRDEGVFIVGSGLSYHNMRGLLGGAGTRGLTPLEHSRHFDAWLCEAVAEVPAQRDAALARWTEAPSARDCHPREEHLMPLMVAAGAALEDRGEAVFRDQVMGVAISAVRFG